MSDKKPTVLIVDDMQENLMLLSDILSQMYDIKIAKNGKKALEIVHKGDVDLILLDIVMPELDGYEVCSILRNEPKSKNIPIIFVTGNSDVEDEKKGFELGAVDYITKPFSPITVKARVKTHLSLYFQTKQLKEYETSLKQKVREKTKELDALNRSLELKVQEESEKNRAKDILIQQQARLSALGEMIGNIAHQWRQPLTVITTTISGLKLKSEFDEVTQEDISKTNEAVLKNANFLSQTIDSFRNFFQKDDTSKIFRIDQLILETIDVVKDAYKHNYIELHIDLQQDIEYFGNKNLLAQVILSLLSNAKEALMFKHIEHKEVWIRCQQDNKETVIEILDNALGVPSEIMEKIFDPYFTTKHQAQGTGLGLYLSQTILQKHFNGTIEVVNKEEGACFRVVLRQ